jgi:hypothetical protein
MWSSFFQQAVHSQMCSSVPDQGIKNFKLQRVHKSFSTRLQPLTGLVYENVVWYLSADYVNITLRRELSGVSGLLIPQSNIKQQNLDCMSTAYHRPSNLRS